MILNKEKEEVYIKLGINMPYGVMCMYYKGDDLYKRMLLDILSYRYKPINRIYLKDNGLEVKKIVDIDMSNGKIYKIISKNSDKIYIGSTYKLLKDRLLEHEIDYNNYKLCKYNYVSSYEVLKYGDYAIKLIEDLGSVDRKALESKESIYIKQNINTCVNIQDPQTKVSMYDNSIDKKKRNDDRKKFLIGDIIKYISENNIVINSMEDMYKIYMERHAYWCKVVR
jgi:hypothetical protein